MVPSYAVGIPDPDAPEDIQGASNRHINPPSSQVLGQFQVSGRPCPPGVGHRNRTMLGQKGEQGFIHPTALAFHIRGMDQKLGAELGNLTQVLRC